MAAATLSARYYQRSLLADKAIDLVDEAAARLKMEITSAGRISMKSTARLTDRDGAAVAAKESNPASRERSNRKELADLKEEATGVECPMAEKDIITKIQTIKEEIDCNIEISKRNATTQPQRSRSTAS